MISDSVPSIQTKFYEETYQPGASVSLSCSAYGNPSPKFEWNVDHQVLGGNSQRINIAAYWSAEGDAVSVLNITEVRTEDGGEYTCTAKNHVGEASHSARLNIYGPPFVRRMSTITTVSGRDVRLRCLYGGYPIETISWEKDGVSLPVDFRQEVPANGTLIVRRVQRLIDSGRYTCRVRSPMGQEAQQQVDVRIMIPPNIDGSTFQGHEVDEGSHARIICGVTDGDLPINFTWLRDGRPMSKDESGIAVRNIDEFSNVLTIKNVMTLHTGKYTCVATNAAASTNRTTELKVRVPPKWRIEPGDVKLVVGQFVTLNCVADGFPTPVTSWMKVIGSVPTGPRQALSNDTRTSLFINGSLYINNAQSEDEGYYFCLTTNGIGPGLNKMIYINIKSPAKFDVHYRQEVARKGKEVNLACKAQGEPPLFFTWEKEENDVTLFPHRYKVNNKEINDGGSSVLRIESVRREDSGVFKCDVKNSYGHDSVTIHLKVLEPPDIPLHVKVVDYGSRKVKLSWSQPFDGNSIILKYRVEGKLSSAEWSDSMLLLSTPTASTTAAEVEGLLPATKYTFRVLAENEVGVGFPSESVSVVTEDEAPSVSPQDVHVRAIDSETLRVTWKPPPHSAWNGELLGYNVGFRPADASTKQYLYSTLELNSKRDSALSTDLKGLIKYTKYGVVVRAFNRVGLGPLSNEILETTAEDVPTESPQEVECSAINSESLQVAWKPPSPLSVNGVLQGYKILYRLAEDWHDNVEGMEEKTSTSVTTSLHHLKKFSNYSVQILAFTAVGDGVKSDPIYCSTLEDVPGSPGDIKALPLSSDTVLVTWKHPKYPNGILTKYSVYVRSTENAKESTTIESVSSSNTFYYWKKDMKEKGRYEFWVTASTSIGEGESTVVITLRAPDSVVAARVASFGDIYVVRQSQDVELACLAVGVPPPIHQWIFKDLTLVTNDKWTIFENGSLIIREVINSDGGNYTCKVHNSYGVDSILYALVVQEPPSPPQITISTATSDMINIKWRAEAGEMPLRGFIVHFKRDFGEWEELNVPKDQNDFVLEGLDCGTRYHVYVSAKNDIGIGKPSQVTIIKTEGTAPIVPLKEKLLSESSTYVTLYLEAWRTGLECPILYFVVEHKRRENRTWTLVSNNVQPQQMQFAIPDLSAATWYNLRMTAHNTAGSTVAYYDFATLTVTGATIATIVAELGDSRALKSNEWTFYFYLSLSIGAVTLVLGCGSVAACLLHNKRRRQTTATQDEKAAKATYVPCNNTEKYERASTPTSFTYLMRNKDRPSSGSRQVSDTSTKVSEEDVCPYATFQISDRKSHAFNEELKTFGDRSPDKPVNVRCIKDPRGEVIYQKGNALHPKYNCVNQVDERLHWSANPGDDLLIPAHLTESALELQISQNCENSHAGDCGDLHVPDLLYHGVESGSSNEDSSPISTCSYELHQHRHSKMLNVDPRLRMNKTYGTSYTMDDTSAFLSLPRSHTSRQESYLMNHHDPRREMEIEDQVWYHNSNPEEYHHYNRHNSALLEMNPVDSSC
ncbi:Down syndrome cell adhesion molecule-like protein 1 [Chamberlinius hualienensis]